MNNRQKLFNDSMRTDLRQLFRQKLLALNLRLAGANYSVSFALEESQALFSHVQHKSALRLSNLFLERSVKQ